MQNKIWLIGISIVAFNQLYCGNLPDTQKVQVQALRLHEPIEMDGRLTEKVWLSDTCINQFIQKNPIEGAKPTEQTEVRIAYDDQAIYVGARLHDSRPDSIVALLGRRDASLSSDFFALGVDPYHDKRSGYYFGVNAAGTLYDGIFLNDDWDDDSWDGVWEGKVHKDSAGWSAEMRIPFSQLRFQNHRENYVWGVNFYREISRKKEELYLVFTPKDGSGFVSRFPDLVGLKNLHPSKNLEFLPYVRSKAEFTHPDKDDPFNDGSRFLPAAGADIKFGLSSNLTLNVSVNPDFGQVEVDPAVVNLSDVETFYQEKRPFFIEGASIFNFGQGGSRSNWGFNWDNPNFFYSRRIGRAPQGELPGNDFNSVPEGARILGAAKLSGKVGDNWNVGAIHAFTAREYADISYQEKRSEAEVEPLTNYSIFRVQKEINQGFRGIGVIGTNAIRSFKDDRLKSELNKQAYTLGLDGWTFLDKEKEWVVTAWGGMSNTDGTKERITELQQNSRHYFQRPDAKAVKVDSNATSLRGYAGRILLNKQKGNGIFNAAIGVIDPGFDLNDLGFVWRTNVINGHIGGGYKWTKPGKIFRETDVIGAVFQSNDFDMNTIWLGVFAVWEAQFLNYYSIDMNVAYNPETFNITRTRGGPITINPSGFQFDVQAESDDRKPLVLGIGFNNYQSPHNEFQREISLDIEWKPMNNLAITLEPELGWANDRSMWVEVENNSDPTATATYGKRYIFADLKYMELSSGIRLNWTFTPKLSLQMYVQPLISSGDYTHFKYLTKPKSYQFTRYGEDASTIRFEDNSYYADADGEGSAPTLQWENPDFNFRSLRGNAVMRWEYLPGSTLYFVWTQSRSDWEEYNGQVAFGRSFDRMVSSAADNIFMIKLNYWLNL